MDLKQLHDRIALQVGGLDGAIDTLVTKFGSYVGKAEGVHPYMRSPGAILCGIPGSGKTKLASALAQCSMLPYKLVHCPDLFASDQGESERNLIQSFEPPATTASSGKFIVILEEIDVLLGSKRVDTLEARMGSLLLDCIDSTSAFVLGTTSLPATLTEEIQRPGRLDTLIELHLKDEAARDAVLKIMLKRFGNIAGLDIARVAKRAHGFSPADLQNLCTRVFMEHRDVTIDGLLSTIETIVPSNLSAFQSKIPRVMFSDIFGMDEVIARVKTLVLEPLCEPERFYEMKVEPPRGALVHGPPGTGKSMLCCAIANELAVNTIWVDASQVRSMIVGESEKALADLFAQARKSSPCILLFDHIDALAPQRGTSEFLSNRRHMYCLIYVCKSLSIAIYKEPGGVFCVEKGTTYLI
ncbi:hypothetical protein LPJ78_000818 [Coemansia sp. RSA 989]|nr:hypothetical protein LPJ78_000818 [Coemansia sp. RSA 989]